MKTLIGLLLAISIAMLTGCGTAGGLVSGLGQDLSKAGEWIKNN